MWSRPERSIIAEADPDLHPQRMRGAFHWHTTDSDGKAPLEIQQTENLVSFLSDIGVHTIELDTLLEANQITSALKVLFHAGLNLKKPLSFHPTQKAYNARSLAAILSGDVGLNKFCAGIHFDRTSGVLSVQYSYCELFYTFTVNSILDRYT